MTSNKCPNCGEMLNLEFAPSGRRSLSAERFVMVACYLAGGWALLDSGHGFWGGVCLVAAVIVPVLHHFLTRFQKAIPIRAREAQERETERLLEIAGHENTKPPVE